jgi:gluconolactonase
MRNNALRSGILIGKFVILLGSFLLALSFAPLDANAPVTELVEFGQGQFPEGLSVAADGTILVGIASTGEVLRVTPYGTANRLAQIPLPPNALLLGIAAIDSTNVYALVSSSDRSNGVWLISAHGARVEQFAALPVGVFPNDLVIDGAGRLFVTDTVGGRVYQVQSRNNARFWAESPLLLGNVASPGPLGIPIGANGIVLSPSEDAVFVAVSEGERIVRIPIRGDGSAGPVSVVAQNSALNGADGIDFGSDGSMYVAVFAQNHVVRVDPGTGRVEVFASGADFHFPAVPRFSPDFRTLYVTNFDAPVLFGLSPGPAMTGLLAINVEALRAGSPPGTDLAAPTPPDQGRVVPPRTGSAGLADDSSREPGRDAFKAAGQIVAVAVIGLLLLAARRHALKAPGNS